MLTDHQRTALHHLAAVAMYGDWRDTRCRQVGLRTSRALQRAGLVELDGQVRTSSCYRSQRSHTRYDEVGRLTVAGWRVALQLGADLQPLLAAITEADSLAASWADRDAAEAARWAARAAELRTLHAELDPAADDALGVMPATTQDAATAAPESTATTSAPACTLERTSPAAVADNPANTPDRQSHHDATHPTTRPALTTPAPASTRSPHDRAASRPAQGAGGAPV